MPGFVPGVVFNHNLDIAAQKHQKPEQAINGKPGQLAGRLEDDVIRQPSCSCQTRCA